MVMKRLLIADATGMFSKPIAKQLNSEFVVKTCDNGDRALELIRKFDPDVLLIDLQLPNTDGLSVLRALRTAGLDTKVIATTVLADTYICAELTRLQVSNIYLKPCSLGSVIACIREVANEVGTRTEIRCEENELDRILLDLGFQMGRGRYLMTHAAVLYLYDHPNCFMTKSLYPALAKQFNGTGMQVEKAIRDAIKNAWENGNRQIWHLYFQLGATGKCGSCPSNEVFLARIANALVQKRRLKKPLEYAKELAM